MATDNFIYQGINRAVSDYAGARACEELINLRPTEGGVVPVMDFSTKMSNKPYHRVFIHHTTSGDKYLAIWKDGTTVKVSQVDQYGAVTGSALFTTPYVSDATLESIYYASAGNILLFSLCDRTNKVYKTSAYTWGAGGYTETEANAPAIDFSVTDNSTVVTVNEDIADLAPHADPGAVVDSVLSGLNAAQEHNPELCLGPVVIAIAYKTKDGRTFWSNGWRVYDPEPLMRSLSGRYKNSNYTWWANEFYEDFYTKYPDGGYVLSGLTVDEGEQAAVTKIDIPGTNVKVHFPRLSSNPSSASYWNADTSIIQSVEVYASKPQYYFNAQAAADGFVVNEVVVTRFCALMLPKADYKDLDLAGQLLYHQASIPMASLLESEQDVTLSFGGNVQVTEDTLETDAGAVKRYGRVLSYNARFHYFDSVSNIKVGMPSFTESTSGSRTRMVFVRYADSDQSDLLYVGNNTVHNTYDYAAQFVIASSINVKEVITAVQDGSGYSVKKYRMTASSAYNYTINEGNPYFDNPLSASEWASSELKGAYDAGQKTDIWNAEPDSINVSEQYNPFVFLVEHSYKAPGNIIDVLPQMAGVVDANYGRDPLNVFTERGTYALTQGSANVLYGAFLPLSNLKAGRGGLSLESGIYFLADGGLWLVSGRQVVLVSEALSFGPHKYIRECLGYKKLSGTDGNYSPDPAPANPFYDASPYLSQVEFKVFATGGQLAYNRFRMELFVSNKNYDYSYVLSLKYRQWFKVSKRLWQDDQGSVLINRPGTVAGTISVLDMSNEMTLSTIPRLVHLQSRPFSMGYQYSHIHRIVAMVRAMLPSANHKLAVGLYGSDDLQHWKLLAYAKRSGKTEYDEQREELVDTPLFLSQLRTTSSARSWRYYTACIGGEIPVDADFPTDIGPVVVDYEPVVRRIG